MKFYINEYDTDYHVWVRSIIKDFNDKKEAEDWCRNHKGGGFCYTIDQELSDKS